jgi:hypothetical protein
MPVHVSESDVERLALGRLTTPESLRVQRHLYECGPCLKRLIEIEYQLTLEEMVANERPCEEGFRRRRCRTQSEEEASYLRRNI